MNQARQGFPLEIFSPVVPEADCPLKGLDRRACEVAQAPSAEQASRSRLECEGTARPYSARTRILTSIDFVMRSGGYTGGGEGAVGLLSRQRPCSKGRRGVTG